MPDLVLSLLCGLLVSLPAWAGLPADDAGALASAIQRHYDQVRDFPADFTHSYTGGVLRKKTVEHGHLAVRKPGRMRWTYTKPEEKVFVSDGVKMYSYIPEDKQVIVATVPPDDQATTPALFLAGKGNLTRDFTVQLVDGARRAGRHGRAQADAETPGARIRLAEPGGRRAHPRSSAGWSRPTAGRHVELFLHEPEGKRRDCR